MNYIRNSVYIFHYKSTNFFDEETRVAIYINVALDLFYFKLINYKG